MALGEKLEELEPLMFQLLVTRAALKNDRKKNVIPWLGHLFLFFTCAGWSPPTYPLIKVSLGEEA